MTTKQIDDNKLHITGLTCSNKGTPRSPGAIENITKAVRKRDMSNHPWGFKRQRRQRFIPKRDPKTGRFIS